MTSSRPPLGASVRGFAAWQFALLLREPLCQRIAELERSPHVHPGYLAELRATYAEVRHAGELWQEWAAICADENAKAVGTQIGSGSVKKQELTPEEAAPMIKKTSARVRQLLLCGALTGRKVGGRWLIDRDSVVSYAGTPKSDVA